MITPEELRRADYSYYPANGWMDKWCVGLFQKAVMDGDLKKYFICWYLFEWPDGIRKAEVEVALFTKSKEFRLKLTADDQTIEDVESFIANAFAALNCVPDKHNN